MVSNFHDYSLWKPFIVYTYTVLLDTVLFATMVIMLLNIYKLIALSAI